MLTNTYQHGYIDALQGRQRILGSEEYRMGYMEGECALRTSRKLELAVLGTIVFVTAFVIACLA